MILALLIFIFDEYQLATQYPIADLNPNLEYVSKKKLRTAISWDELLLPSILVPCQITSLPHESTQLSQSYHAKYNTNNIAISY